MIQRLTNQPWTQDKEGSGIITRVEVVNADSAYDVKYGITTEREE